LFVRSKARVKLETQQNQQSRPNEPPWILGFSPVVAGLKPTVRVTGLELAHPGK